MNFLVGLAVRGFKLALCLMVVLGTLFFFRESIFKSSAQLWIVDEAVTSANAVVVLGGGHDWRPFAAADLYLSGKASLILLAQPSLSPSQEILQQSNDAAVSFSVLNKKGVPAEHIIPFGKDVTSTREEAMALRQWVMTNNKGIRAVILPTDPFHTRRVRWIFNRALEGTGTRVIVQSVPHPRYNADDWWKHEEGVVNFQNEIVKYVFYAISY